jgi:hypothetical protein
VGPALAGAEAVRFLDPSGDDLTLTTAVEEHPLYAGRRFRASIARRRER